MGRTGGLVTKNTCCSARGTKFCSYIHVVPDSFKPARHKLKTSEKREPQ